MPHRQCECVLQAYLNGTDLFPLVLLVDKLLDRSQGRRTFTRSKKYSLRILSPA